MDNKIYLGKGLFSLVDICDYDMLNKFTWGISRSNYATTTINGKTVSMHRFIMGLSDDDLVVDHIDGHRLDNRKSNLRICTKTQNMCNKLARRNTSSKYNGVIYNHQLETKHIT